MNKNEDLLHLKSVYMKQSYPKDIDKIILNTIANSYENNKSKKYFKIRKRTVYLAASFLFILFSINTNKINSNNFTNYKLGNNAKMISFNEHIENNYILHENKNVISVYPKDKILNKEDSIFNISKITGKEIKFKDLLRENIDLFNTEAKFGELILNTKNKFYIDEDGSYVVILINGNSKNNLIKIDRILQDRIFKEEYIIK